MSLQAGNIKIIFDRSNVFNTYGDIKSYGSHYVTQPAISHYYNGDVDILWHYNVLVFFFSVYGILPNYKEFYLFLGTTLSGCFRNTTEVKL